MEKLLAAAMVGTARLSGGPYLTDTPADPLLATVEAAPERVILLAAGAAAISRQAGRRPDPAPTLPVPAPAETLDVPAPSATALLAELLAGQATLLPEALTLLARSGKRLPAALLVTALNTTDQAVRAAALPVLGARGRWLAAQNPAWRWVAESAPQTEPTDIAHAEAIWLEGRPEQRLAILSQMRGTNPGQARAWLSGAWKREKAELRHDLLDTLAVNLSPEDEPFLESALDDRSERVRVRAASLLARLPRSALAGRMRARAEAMLACEPEDQGGRLGRIARALHHTSAGAKLLITLPDDLEADWMRDGVVATPPGASQEIGGRAWWMQQVLALVPPGHWVGQFLNAPDALVAAAMRTEWSTQIVEAWSRAALLHRDPTWAGPLWDWWLDTASRSTRDRDATQRQMLLALLALLPPAEAERRILPLLSGDARFARAAEPYDPFWRALLTTLPAPWSEAFSAACLNSLHRLIAAGPASRALTGSIWFHHLDAVAAGIAPTLLHEEVTRWQAPDLLAELPGPTSRRDRAAQCWAETLASFVEIVRLRHRVYRELSES